MRSVSLCVRSRSRPCGRRPSSGGRAALATRCAARAGAGRLAAAARRAGRVRDLRRALLRHPLVLQPLVLLLVLDARSLAGHAILLRVDEGENESAWRSRFACSCRATRTSCGSSRPTTDRAIPEGLLADPRTLMLVAFDGGLPVGFVLAHELPRRHGDRSKLFVYEVDVAESHRRRGIAWALLARLVELSPRTWHSSRLRTDGAGQRPGQRSLPQRGRHVVDGRDVGLLVRGRLTTLRPAGADDVDRLVAWHADPEVARYWDDETFTPAEMAERLTRPERRGMDRRGGM